VAWRRIGVQDIASLTLYQSEMHEFGSLARRKGERVKPAQIKIGWRKFNRVASLAYRTFAIKKLEIQTRQI
jgi:hypothetical protein